MEDWLFLGLDSTKLVSKEPKLATEVDEKAFIAIGQVHQAKGGPLQPKIFPLDKMVQMFYYLLTQK